MAAADFMLLPPGEDDAVADLDGGHGRDDGHERPRPPPRVRRRDRVHVD